MSSNSVRLLLLIPVSVWFLFLVLVHSEIHENAAYFLFIKSFDLKLIENSKERQVD